MHGLESSLQEARAIAEIADQAHAVRVTLFPPATLIHRMATLLRGTTVGIGGQDAHAEAGGAYTGDLSPEMLRDAGASAVILGHSERREGHGENDAAVAAKVSGALRAHLEPFVCVGENERQRRSGRAAEVVAAQIRSSIPDIAGGRAFCVAYEPVWAIGSGMIPTIEQIAEIALVVREVLTNKFPLTGKDVPLLYGGSVKPANALEVLSMPTIDGVLVGGASLTATELSAIIASASRSAVAIQRHPAS